MTAPNISDLMFLTVPLATGDHLRVRSSGEPVEVTAITVEIALADGSTRAQALTRLGGTGWWMPKEWNE